MPEGWTIQRPAESDAAFWDQIAECAGLAPGSLGEAALGDSAVTADDFYDPSGQTGVEHVVGVANDEATAIAAMAANADEALADCYESIITANYAAGNDPTDTRPDLTISAVQVERQDLSGFESDDEMVWYTVVTTFNLGGQTIDRYVELIFLRDEQVLSELRLSNVDEPFPEDLIEPIVTRTQERMAALAEA